MLKCVVSTKKIYLVIALELPYSRKSPGSIAFRISWISQFPTWTHAHLDFLHYNLNISSFVGMLLMNWS